MVADNIAKLDTCNLCFFHSAVVWSWGRGLLR